MRFFDVKVFERGIKNGPKKVPRIEIDGVTLTLFGRNGKDYMASPLPYLGDSAKSTYVRDEEGKRTDNEIMTRKEKKRIRPIKNRRKIDQPTDDGVGKKQRKGLIRNKSWAL